MIRALIRFPIAILVVPMLALIAAVMVFVGCLVSGWKALLEG